MERTNYKFPSKTYSRNNIIGIQCNVLNPSSTVVVHILLNLTLFLPWSWFVDWELKVKIIKYYYSSMINNTFPFNQNFICSMGKNAHYPCIILYNILYDVLTLNSGSSIHFILFNQKNEIEIN